VDSSLIGVNEGDQMARHMKGESIELEAHIPLGSAYKENFLLQFSVWSGIAQLMEHAKFSSK
jgi:hypothetical protein